MQPANTPSKQPSSGAAQPLQLLWEDPHLLVINKPSGLLSVPGRGEANADCAISRIQQTHPEALVVHRLDMGTSGLLVFGRSAAAQRTLSMAFEQRRTHKRYVAVVAGRVTEDLGSIDLPLICDWPRRPRQKVDAAQGKPSLTHWEVISRDAVAKTTRLSLTPVTGRSHQLRVHLMALGHPILGDELYAPPEIVQLSPRLLLHAETLTLPHPASGEPLTLHAPVPF